MLCEWNKVSDKDRREAGPSTPVIKSTAVIPGFEQARQAVDNHILEAEKFKASIEPPQGRKSLNISNLVSHNADANDTMSQRENMVMQQTGVVLDNVAGKTLWNNQPLVQEEQLNDHRQIPQGNMMIPARGRCVSDDDFFHLTCNIDSTLRKKIEQGDYVDLEKLMPKDRSSMYSRYSESSKLEWIQQDGSTFLAPVSSRDNKITNVKKWDQAFRIYATFYTDANPHRSREIWQYVDIIHTAATSFVWDNVYNYDVTFRHLMEFNPMRSWGTTYTQMWNLALKEPLMKNGFNRNSGSANFGGSSTSHNNESGNKKGSFKRKPDYCWAFNRGIKCKFGRNCRYIEKCSYCNATTHGANTCTKLDKKSPSNSKTTHHKDK